MKKLFKKEKNKLPLTFKYIEELRTKKNNKNNSTGNYVPCEKFQTDYLLREKLIKSLTRLT